MTSDAQYAAIDRVVRCGDEFSRALAIRDAIDDTTSLAWHLAHLAARSAAIAKDAAFRHAYTVGALPRPHWAGK